MSGWNDKRNPAFRTFAFLAGASVKSAYFLAAVFTKKTDNDGLFRHCDRAAASWALAPLTCVFIPDINLATTVLAAKLNHENYRSSDRSGLL
jgi:hypothetical protein